MTRFEKQEIASSKLPVPLDVAADELKSFIERQVREIIDAAHERAAQIESDARKQAQEIKGDAERKAQGILEDAFNRAWRILDGIDLLESGVGDLIGALRAEMEGFAADLGSAVPAEEGRLVPREAQPPTSPTRELATRREIEKVEHQNNHAEVEEMIIGQLATMHSEGKPRSEAERFVRRFKQGEDYLHIVDRIYGSDGSEPTGPPPVPAPEDHTRWGFRLRRG